MLQSGSLTTVHKPTWTRHCHLESSLLGRATLGVGRSVGFDPITQSHRRALETSLGLSCFSCQSFLPGPDLCPEISTTACSHRNGIWSPPWTVRPQGRGGSLRSPPQLLTSTAQEHPDSRCRGPGRLPRSDPRPDMDSLLHLLLIPSAGPGSPLTLSDRASRDQDRRLGKKGGMRSIRVLHLLCPCHCL